MNTDILNMEYAHKEAMSNAYTAAQYNGGNAASVQPARGSESAIQDIASRLNRLSQLVEQVESLANRTVGVPPPSPQPNGAGTLQGGPPSSLSGKLNLITTAVDQLNSRLTSAIERLEQFV